MGYKKQSVVARHLNLFKRLIKRKTRDQVAVVFHNVCIINISVAKNRH